MNVIPIHDTRHQSDRLAALHTDHVSLNDLAAGLGSPADWLLSAQAHRQDQLDDAGRIVSIGTSK